MATEQPTQVEDVVQEQATAAAEALPEMTGDLKRRFDLCRAVAEECVGDANLRSLLEKKEHPVCYDGFEPSGRMHIAQGILKAINVNRLTQAGCKFIFWVADWFALMNNKLGGDLKKIQTCGKYMIEIWKAAGMDLSMVEFKWASEEMNARSSEYWLQVIDIARSFNVPRIVRCCTIMGRRDDEDLTAAQIMYPCMQCADIFFLKADICQLGLDQRKVNVLALEYCDKIKRKNKPVILSHHMMMGLKEGQEKMSKSDPDSAIFMDDDEVVVGTKIKKAFCPPRVVAKNPCMDYMKWIVFPRFGRITVQRRDKEPLVCESYEELEKAYTAPEDAPEAVWPNELKDALKKYINEAIAPVREHFKTNKEAAALKKQVNSFKITK
eukprot:TRINITY_DN15849_c0_g1_i1.p1 TRINITY_DN15849_c0_g1~~TRINITY_DN15849_c0_g1_i1.p1  ORF type:complete len:389 (-),score=84.56 TRINITY_DN15849_c0_g1_i1:6-1148(-)